MSSQSEFLILLSTVQTNLYRYGGPILALLGTVGSLLNLIVFTQKNLRKNPCSIYFIAFNISNLLFIYSSMLAIILDLGYKINPSSYDLFCCRLRSYVIFLFEALGTTYVLFASIDRVLITSPNARTRQRSTAKLAYTCIISITIFWMLFHSHAFVLTDILQTGPSSFACYFRPGWYPVFVGYYILLKGLIIPSLLLIFAMKTIKNVQNSRRVLPTHHEHAAGNHSTSAKDKQLIIMLLMDIIILLICVLAYAGILMYQQITQYQLKSSEQRQIELFVRYILSFTAYFPFCASGYIHLLVSKTFRVSLKKASLRH